MELNKIYCTDVLDGLRGLDNESVDVIITSPPYNKRGLNKGINNPKSKWVCTIDYNGDANVDNLPEEEYEKWQIEILKECHRVLKPKGSMFYNHKNRIWTGHGEIISPYKWLYQTPFKIRQEIIWDRGSTNNVATCRYLPSTELIFWLTKDVQPNFYRGRDTIFKKEVWSFPFKTNTAHPAPFPIDLPDNILHCIPKNEDGTPLIVLDPFMGSGTVAVSAINHGCDYIGFEKFQTYVDMANERIVTETKNERP
jgi:modification methylase